MYEDDFTGFAKKVCHTQQQSQHGCVDKLCIKVAGNIRYEKLFFKV